jgi:hypothetical protein
MASLAEMNQLTTLELQQLLQSQETTPATTPSSATQQPTSLDALYNTSSISPADKHKH